MLIGKIKFKSLTKPIYQKLNNLRKIFKIARIRDYQKILCKQTKKAPQKFSSESLVVLLASRRGRNSRESAEIHQGPINFSERSRFLISVESNNRRDIDRCYRRKSPARVHVAKKATAQELYSSIVLFLCTVCSSLSRDHRPSPSPSSSRQTRNHYHH